MTKVTFYRSPEGRLLGYEARGHALSASRLTSEKTMDLVCSAVSALTQTGVNALDAVARITPVIEVSDGRLYCMLPDDVPGGSAEAQTILETIRIGIQGISEAYPRFVQLCEATKE